MGNFRSEFMLLTGRIAEDESGVGFVSREDKRESGKNQAEQAASLLGGKHCGGINMKQL